MAKPIRFPILEIVTLLVVLFACVLVIIPGFDEYTTSMLFDVSQRVSSSFAEVADNKSTNAAIPDSDKQSATPVKRLVADNRSLDVADKSIYLPNSEIQLDADNHRDDQESKNFSPDAGEEPVPESLEIPPKDTMVRKKLTEDSSHLSEPDSDVYTQQSSAIVGSVSVMDSSSTTRGVSSVSPAFEASSPNPQLIPLNEFIETSKISSLQTRPSASLPKIINQIGNSRQQQPEPTRIYRPQVFESDLRVVVNPNYGEISDQPLLNIQSVTTQPVSSSDSTCRMDSPTDRPYQIRTTALPAIESTANTNDFVPK